MHQEKPHRARVSVALRDGEFMEVQAAALEVATIAIAITDREGTILWVNSAFQQLTGCRREDVPGRSIHLPKSDRHPTSLCESMWDAILSGRKWQSVFINERKDGSLYHEDMSIIPVPNAQGEITHFIAIKQDLTEHRREAEESLQKSEEQFRQLVDNLHEVLFIHTPDPVRMAYISPAYDEIWGRPRQELYDRPEAWMESLHPEDREPVGRFYERAMQGVRTDMRYRVMRPDGSVRWIRSRSFPVHNSRGKFIRVVGIAEDVTERRQKKNALEKIHQKLNATLEEANRQTREAAQLTELVDILQSCQTAEEAYKIIEGFLQSTFGFPAGALCITSPSRDLVVAVATWGDALGTEKAFPPEDCWALRRGKTHWVNDPASSLRCRHVGSSVCRGHVCVPLAAQGETLGVLYLNALPKSLSPDLALQPDPTEILARQAKAVGERVSLALANLRLREVLRGQSIRDPLTGLFNRRFMEESFERELRRAVRGKQQLALLMLDIDHFKRFNDMFGHQAGDALLRALGNLLRHRTRGQDVACRFGGEEFAFILAGTSIEAATKRAELLRKDIAQLNVQHAGLLLGAVTLSFGIAVYPDHGDSADALLKRADDALYRTKSEGRDKIVIGDPVPVKDS